MPALATEERTHLHRSSVYDRERIALTRLLIEEARLILSRDGVLDSAVFRADGKLAQADDMLKRMER